MVKNSAQNKLKIAATVAAVFVGMIVYKYVFDKRTKKNE